MQQGYQCPYCRNNVAYGQPGCSRCGNRLQWQQQPQPTPQQPVQPSQYQSPPQYQQQYQQLGQTPQQFQQRPTEFQQEPEKKKSSKVALIIIGVLAVLFIGTCSICLNSGKTTKDTQTSKDTQPSMVDLKGTISFDGSQFTITNKDTFNWIGVKFELNRPDGLFEHGYILTCPLIEAGQVYTVGCMQFAKSDGTRFNPLTSKVLEMSISCKTPSNQTGTLFLTWNK